MDRSRYNNSSSNNYGSSRSNNNNNNGYSSNKSDNRNDYSRNNNSRGSNRNEQNSHYDIVKPKWNISELEPIIKNIYDEHPNVKNRDSFLINQYLNTNNIVVAGDKFINPIFNFNETNFPDILLQKIRQEKFSSPTIIQSMCWPILMSGNDIVGIAQTGSGKTLGFLLPLMMQIFNQRKIFKSRNIDYRSRSPTGLVIAPTRELALQIQEVAETYGRSLGISNMCIYGGAPKGPQKSQMSRGADICIATPGRLLDFLKENYIKLNEVTYLVLDEADRMLDMGFEPQITKIIEQTRPDRQTAMFSATWPKEVRRLAENFLSNSIQITIGVSELSANPKIKQIVEVCEEHEKECRVKRILSEIMNSNDSKVIIFAETKRRVDSFSRFIRNSGFYCLTIHGDKKQNEREYVLNEFRSKSKSILVATDVAARGLNIEDIKYVINIDFPSQHEDYIHRIGRTARSTNSGIAYTLVTIENANKIPKLIEILRETGQEISRNLLDLAKRNQSFGGGSRGGNDRRGNFRGNNNYRNDGRFSNNDNDNYSRKRNASEMASSLTTNNNRQDNWNDGDGYGETKRTRFSKTDDQHRHSNEYPSASSSSYNRFEEPRPLFSNVSNFNRSNNFH